MKRLTTFKSILWTIVGLAMASGITRMLFGLGSVTNQSDAVPWGIWKGINVIPGIALAGGGFVMTAIIYVLRRQEFARYSKFAVLLAFLGYISAATALVVELGLPWMVWHPIIYWQHHSALFEVSWCVMLYLTVLFLEFVPVPLEEIGWFARLRMFLTKYKIYLVILGIMISTLHQSSLGTLFLITPEKLHPLWYTSLLPILFFISAVAVGPLMVILAVLAVSALYRKELERKKLAGIGLISMGILCVYGLIRMIDIIATGKLPQSFNGSWQSNIFWLEMMLICIIPIVFLAVKKLRYSTAGLWAATISSVLGIVLNRADIAGIMLAQTGRLYIPTIYEIFISFGILSAAILVFLFCIDRFKLWETKWEDPRQNPEAKPEFDHATEVWLGSPRLASRTVYSLIFIIALSLGFALISGDRIKSENVEDVIASPARGTDVLYIDGNHDSYGVSFPHKEHMHRVMEADSCSICHHMNMPLDKNSDCADCHRKMYSTFDAFRHDWHAAPDGGNIACTECHPADEPRLKETVAKCDKCHKDLYPEGATIVVKQYIAESYTDALHGTCVPCHKDTAAKDSTKAQLALCTSCHNSPRPSELDNEVMNAYRDTSYNHVVLPYVRTDN
ncbi:MAG: NrfD/PsrC family molybdoenzyme membrane anchor subunit [Candidatus Zixiibacteriota bacterium]